MNEYNFPEVYDAEYGGFKADFDIFCNTIACKTALDIACGTGRITIKLAELGVTCIGIDENEPMLKRAREKAERNGLNITYINMDMRTFNLDQKFDLITMAGNSFQSLLTEQDQISCLASICKHLKPNGKFIMNSRNPTEDEMRATKDFEYWHNFEDSNGQTVQVYGMQTFNPSSDTVKYTTKRVWPTFETTSEIELKFTNLEKLLELLNQCGLKALETYGSFSKIPFDPVTSKDIIVICEKII